VVPTAARDELGLTPGVELEVRVVDRRLELQVPATTMRLTTSGDTIVASADREMPVLTTEAVRATLERIHR